jgi:hypothetical protein
MCAWKSLPKDYHFIAVSLPFDYYPGLLWGNVQGQIERERCPFTQLTLDPNLTSMLLYSLLDDGQPQPTPLAPEAAGIRGTIGGVEDVRQILLSDTHSLIGDANTQPILPLL